MTSDCLVSKPTVGIIQAVFCAVLFGAAGVLTAESGGVIALTFDDPGAEVTTAKNVANEALSPAFREKTSEVVSEAAKFGPAGLKMLAGETALVQSLGGFEWSDAFSRETDKLTVACWLFIPEDAPEENIRFVSREGAVDANGTWFFTLIQSKRPYFSVLVVPEGGNEPDGYTTSLGGDYAVPRGQWTHVAMTFNQGDVVFYVDGDEIHMGSLGHNTLPDQGHEAPERMRFNMLSLPEGAMADDFFMVQGKSLDAFEIGRLMDAGIEAYLKE